LNRPWHVWWDFRWEDNDIKWVVVQTNHPDYKHVDYIYRFTIDECADEEGYIDSWIETWFNKFSLDIKEGRVSIHEIMKKEGYEKIKR
jgi:hypothetical protein